MTINSIVMPTNCLAHQSLVGDGRDCQICLEPLENCPELFIHFPVVGENLHVFHGECIGKWKNECPTCRAVIQAASLPQFLKFNGLFLKHLEDKRKEFQFCLEATRQTRKALSYVPRGLRNRVILHLVSENPKQCEGISRDFFSPSLIEEIIKQNYQAALYVPTALITDRVAMEVLKNHNLIFQGVPVTQLSYPLVEEMARQKPEVLRSIPEVVQRKIIFELGTRDPAILTTIPLDCLNPKLVLEVVRQNPEALCFVPWRNCLPSRFNLMMKMVQLDHRALLEIPMKFLTHRDLREMVRQVPEAFTNLPFEWIEKVIRQDLLSLQEFPLSCLSYELVEGIVQQNKGAIHYAPEGFRARLIRELVIRDPKSFRDIPTKFLSSVLVREIVRQNPEALLYTRKSGFLPSIEELAVEIVKLDSVAFLQIPKVLRGYELLRKLAREVPEAFQVLSAELIDEIVHQDPRTLQSIPEKYLTIELIEQIAKNTPRALRFLPKKTSK